MKDFFRSLLASLAALVLFVGGILGLVVVLGLAMSPGKTGGGAAQRAGAEPFQPASGIGAEPRCLRPGAAGPLRRRTG